MITSMKINENNMLEVVFAKYFEWVLNGLIGSICRIATQIQGRKSFLKY